jgi:hypothetical protein
VENGNNRWGLLVWTTEKGERSQLLEIVASVIEHKELITYL